MLTLDQSKYIDLVLKWFQNELCNADVATSNDPNSAANLSINMGAPVSYPFKEFAGCLQWTALSTQPDISYSAGNVLKLNNKPAKPHVI